MEDDRSLSVRLSGRWGELRPITQGDYPHLRLMELSADVAHSWRHGAATPSPEQYAASLWAGVVSQYLVTSRQSGVVVGLVACYNHDAVNGHAYLAAVRFGESTSDRRAFFEGCAVFISHLFRMLPIRKLYLESPEYAASKFGSGQGRILRLEGRLLDHRYHDGRYWDHLIYSITREAATEMASRVFRARGRDEH